MRPHSRNCLQRILFISLWVITRFMPRVASGNSVDLCYRLLYTTFTTHSWDFSDVEILVFYRLIRFLLNWTCGSWSDLHTCCTATLSRHPLSTSTDCQSKSGLFPWPTFLSVSLFYQTSSHPRSHHLLSLWRQKLEEIMEDHKLKLRPNEHTHILIWSEWVTLKALSLVQSNLSVMDRRKFSSILPGYMSAI